MSVSCAVLLDRDGTLIEDKHYLSEPSGVALLPGVGRRCRVWFRRDIAFSWCPTNPAWAGGISLNRLSWQCQKRLEELLEPYGVAFTDAVWCPHAPEESCFCRKPLAGMHR